jgi:hypothetical protein
LAVLLGFSALADGKNSGRWTPETGLPVNNANAIEPLCRRRARIAFFRKPRAHGLIFRDNLSISAYVIPILLGALKYRFDIVDGKPGFQPPPA